jgi:hypothetical protein
LEVREDKKMSAIQVAIRMKPEKSVVHLSARKATPGIIMKSPFALDEDQLDGTNIGGGKAGVGEICVPWRVQDHKTLCYDGKALPEGVRPSGPLSFTFGKLWQ